MNWCLFVPLSRPRRESANDSCPFLTTLPGPMRRDIGVLACEKVGHPLPTPRWYPSGVYDRIRIESSTQPAWGIAMFYTPPNSSRQIPRGHLNVKLFKPRQAAWRCFISLAAIPGTLDCPSRLQESKVYSLLPSMISSDNDCSSIFSASQLPCWSLFVKKGVRNEIN